MNEKMIKALKPICAMICITVVEAYAISVNMNGVMLSIIVAAIAGLGGFTAGRRS